MNPRLISVIVALAFGAGMSGDAQAQLNIAGAMTAEYLQQCEKDQNSCRDFTNNVLQVLTSAALLGQAKLYKGCAPVPLTAEQTSQLVRAIASRLQPAASGSYASDDIAAAAEALWPCK